MAAITVELVKELRERTGGGMLECKKALEAAAGDIEKAIDAMRKAGQAKAAKKGGRIAAEGAIAIRIAPDRKEAVLIEFNSETDFVARDDNFQKFVSTLADQALTAKVTSVESLLALPYQGDPSKTCAEIREALVAKTGENIQVRRLSYKKTDRVLYSYLHGSRIGVVVELSAVNDELGKDVAMHIAASAPQFVAAKDVAEEATKREKEIYLAQALESGKPREIAEKLVQGRMQKFLNEITLLGQPFVKNPDITVMKLLEPHKVEVLSFVRFAVGEGIEKKENDFAKEVQEMAGN